EWPPAPEWADAVEEAGRTWSALLNDHLREVPDLVAEEWAVVRERADAPLEELARGTDRRLWEALLTLAASADGGWAGACAGLGVALDTADGEASAYRARGRELLVRTGSIARFHPSVVRVLPKVRTPPSGRPAFSRYACVPAPGTAARWQKMPARHRGTD